MSDRRSFDRIIGQDLAKRILIKAVRENSPAHAYVFLGLEGTGKLTTAVEFAKALNCLDSSHGRACDKCANCTAVAHGTFPDIRIWTPGSRTGKDTSIEQMREMRDLAKYGPVTGKWRVNIIEQGDTLNDEAANCILKLVEEPPDYLVNIILYRNAASVIPTIRSRCQAIRFSQVETDVLVSRLSEQFGNAADESDFIDEHGRLIASYAQGCPGRAIRMVGDETILENRDMMAGIAGASASKKNPFLALKLAEALRSIEPGAQDDDEDEADTDNETSEKASGKKKKNTRLSTLVGLDMLLMWYRDLLAAKLQGEDAPLVNSDKRSAINSQAQKHKSAEELYAAVESIMKAKRAVIGNANAQIVTEALVARLMV